MFPYGIMCTLGETKFHFVVRNQKPLNLACRASFDEKTLAQQVGPGALGMVHMHFVVPYAPEMIILFNA